MNDLTFNTWDFIIKKLDTGQEVLQLKGTVAFDEGMIKYAREVGVRDEIIEEKIEIDEE